MNSKRITRRFFTVAALGTSAVSMTGCFGSFPLIRKLWKFNDSFGSKWVKWLIFLLFSILPVYTIASLGDVLVMNLVEFWTGKTLLSQGETRKVVADNGDVVEFRRESDDSIAVRTVSNGGQVNAQFRVHRSTDRVWIENEGEQVLAQVRGGVKDSSELLNAQNQVVASMSAAEWSKAQDLLSKRSTLQDAMAMALAPTTQSRLAAHRSETSSSL